MRHKSDEKAAILEKWKYCQPTINHQPLTINHIKHCLRHNGYLTKPQPTINRIKTKQTVDTLLFKGWYYTFCTYMLHIYSPYTIYTQQHSDQIVLPQTKGHQKRCRCSVIAQRTTTDVTTNSTDSNSSNSTSTDSSQVLPPIQIILKYFQ